MAKYVRPAPRPTRAFVIMPINKAEPNLVLERIIEPACAALDAKLEPYHGGHDTEKQTIMVGVVDAILCDRAVIAVLTDYNPNVMYELGVAHSAGRPTVLLQREGVAIPHDIKDERVIFYSDADLVASDGPRQGGACAALIEALEGVCQAPSLFRSPFNRDKLDGLGRQLSSIVVHDKFNDISFEEFSALFNEASEFLIIAGVTLYDFARMSQERYTARIAGQTERVNFKDLLEAAMADGVQVTLVMMHPDHVALPHLLTELKDATADAITLDQVRSEMATSYRNWKSVAETWDRQVVIEGRPDLVGKLRIVQLRNGIVKERVSMSERAAIVSPTYYRQPLSGHGPAVYANWETSFYKELQRDLLYLMKINPEPKPGSAQQQRQRGGFFFSRAPKRPSSK